MLKFAFRNMMTKKVQTILIMLSITVSTCVASLAYNVSSQVSDGITSTAGYYSAIIGSSGSATQLAMNTMYFTDTPCGTIPYEIMNDLLRDGRVNTVIPFAMADSYNGYNVVGTTPEFLETKPVAEGDMFDKSGVFEVVVGSNVAQTCKLHVGDEIHTSHSVGEEHAEAFKVVGILNETHTVYDNTVFTELKSIWEVHAHEHEEGHEEHDEHDEDCCADENMVCSFCVKTKNPAYAMTLVNDYNGKIISDDDGCSWTLQAIEPMSVVRAVLEDTNTTKYIVYALCGIILAMNILVISIITLLNMYYASKEINLMRLIGISIRKINTLYLIENSFTGLISCILAFFLSHLALSLMGGFVADMGVVLIVTKVYPVEFIILLGVFLISIIPTVICTNYMSGRYEK